MKFCWKFKKIIEQICKMFIKFGENLLKIVDILLKNRDNLLKNEKNNVIVDIWEL